MLKFKTFKKTQISDRTELAEEPSLLVNDGLGEVGRKQNVFLMSWYDIWYKHVTVLPRIFFQTIEICTSAMSGAWGDVRFFCLLVRFFLQLIATFLILICPATFSVFSVFIVRALRKHPIALGKLSGEIRK